MKKITWLLLVLVVAAAVVLSGCGESKKSSDSKPGVGNVKVETKNGGVADVCNYFPKELVESALGKPIPKVEAPMTGSNTCYYYTKYVDNYENRYSGGKKPGGPKVVVVYDTKDFVKDRVSNEKSGSKYTSDSSIGMDNFVVRNKVNKIWLVALSLGDDQYIRMKAFDNAVTGDEMVGIARKFAEKIKSGK